MFPLANLHLFFLFLRLSRPHLINALIMQLLCVVTAETIITSVIVRRSAVVIALVMHLLIILEIVQHT